MYSHYASASSLPVSLSFALESAFMAAEDCFDDDDPVRRPAVPGSAEQELDTDYDPDPEQEATPLKNAPKKTPARPARK